MKNFIKSASIPIQMATQRKLTDKKAIVAFVRRERKPLAPIFLQNSRVDTNPNTVIYQILPKQGLVLAYIL